MRTPVFTALLLLTVAGPASGDSEKQQRLDAAKMDNCPRLKGYFEKRAGACPKIAAKARALECASPEDHDTLNSMLRACAAEIDASPRTDLAGESAADVPVCRAVGDTGAVLADLPEQDASKCRKKMKEALAASACDGTQKKVVAELRRKGKKPAELSVRCPKRR